MPFAGIEIGAQRKRKSAQEGVTMAMFSKGTEAGVTRAQSLIQEGMSVRGDMKAEGDIRLDGALEGSLVSKSKVIIGCTGVIHADLEAAEVLVMGRIHGKLIGHRRIELRKGAHVEGDLSTAALVIEEGVFFQGLCQMTGAGQAGGAGVGKDGRSIQGGNDLSKTIGQDLYAGTGAKSSN
jgi:cytoskeletal protein CcmA (bactofilin family)